jgi:hypothetical protein
MEQRKCEFAVLRLLGASRMLILCLILLEAFILVYFDSLSAGILLSVFLAIMPNLRFILKSFIIFFIKQQWLEHKKIDVAEMSI